MKTAIWIFFFLWTIFAWSQNLSNPSTNNQRTGSDISATAPAVQGGDVSPPSAPAKSVEVQKQAEREAADDQTSPEYCLGQKDELDTDSVADQISLYYFGDVSRLMRLLNPRTKRVHTDSAAVQDGEAKRRALLQAELELTKQQSEVNRLQADLQAKEERLRQSEARFSLSQALLDKASANQTQAARNQSRLADRLANAQKNADDHPDDAGATSELTVAKLAKDRADQQVEDANKKQTQAQSERDAVQTQVTSDHNDQSGLAGKIEEAKNALETAQKGVADQRGKTLLAAAEEMESFTHARDNAAYSCAPGDVSSSDPARRVTLVGFDDSKTIFLRGTSEDVQAVERIIAQFDRPAPQARLSLWTLELNSDATKSGTNKLNETLQIVEEELADTRVRLAGSVSALRDSVLEEVNKPQAVPNSRVLRTSVSAAERRAALYDNELLTDLSHFNQSLPDPAVVTTLGESLVALTLADKEHRANILNNFRKRLLQQFGELRLSASQLAAQEKRPLPEFTDDAFASIQGRADSSYLSFNPKDQVTGQWKVDLPSLLVAKGLSREDSANLHDFQRLFPATMRALGLVQKESQTQTDEGAGRSVKHAAPPQARPSPQLVELKQAFTRLLIGRQLDRLSTHLAEADSHERDARSSSDGSSNLEDERRRKRLHTVAIRRLAVALNFFQKTLSAQLSDECGWKLEPISDDFLKAAGQPDKAGEAAEEDIHTQAAIAIACLKDLYPPKFQSAREAAANEMLKQMIVAFEDDLDRHFIRPMINRIRAKVNRSKGVSVGVVQRTSLLATNRLLARVDPRGSSQLGLGQDQDILGAVTQLAQLYTQEQMLGPLGLLPALQALPRKPGPELYAVNTGAEFKVTPIFDPSGQALRFQLDYIAANRVQEPTGTKDPQLSRIERHTINTEVQLSNMELREVTRFEADAALGIPTRKTGGIPLLNEIPGIKEVPLIGYFVRRAGHTAVMQESIIFGQTTTYPTISDLLGLEVGSDSEGANKNTPLPTRITESSPRSEPGTPTAPAVAATAPRAAAPQTSGGVDGKKPEPQR